MAEETKSTENQQAETKPEKTYSEAEYIALQNQLNDANKTIQSFKDMDIESIKKSAEDWKQKAEQAENDRKAFEHRTKLQQYVKGLHLKDDIYEQHVLNLLIEKNLQFENDKLIGGDDVVQAFRESHADAFAPNPLERAAAPTSSNAPVAMSGVETAFYEMNPNLKK
ncbi:MAG: phage scaffolding protein [Oscillospiraceae bacterium]|nr:phage scaffolding protein [Oscillospiraceae bacterium]